MLLIEFEYTFLISYHSSFLSSLLQPQPFPTTVEPTPSPTAPETTQPTSPPTAPETPPPTPCESQKWAYIEDQCVRGSSDIYTFGTAEDCCGDKPNCLWFDECTEESGVFNTPEPTVSHTVSLSFLSYFIFHLSQD